ncbi:hypothetical protein AB6E05_16330 [Vibrio alginolyticus]|uniref:hypothetical protein n=1 Tax=Vibrio alginolyticus TaxID=663 RepID=UPI00215FB93B|nr:hypothetical protein [Vibrio alginolyticus]MCS0178986.1 hypothetical protein [Vibrio alginolyticus]
MEIRRLILLLLVFCNVSWAHNLDEMSEVERYKAYALSMCLSNFYQKGELYSDAIKAMQGYREYSNLPLEAFHELIPLLEGADLRLYSSKKGGKVEIAYCIDFAQSSKILSIFNIHSGDNESKP